MATYILLDENRKSAAMGTDCFIWIDDRLSTDGKVDSAIESLKRMFGIRPKLVESVRYIANYNRTHYDFDTYQYSGKLIPVRFNNK
jgi:hypothetical protein